MSILDKIKCKNDNISSCAPITIAFLGDSVTQGCFELCKGYQCDFDGYTDYEAVYHAYLKKMLNYVFPNVPINMINAGIGGNSAQNGLERVGRDVLAYSPDLVVVCFGLNDVCGGIESLEKYVSALKEIFTIIRSRDIDIIFMTPNMLNTYQSPLTVPDSLMDFASMTVGIQNNGVMDEYMNAARRLCSDMGIPVCDCYEKWKELHQAGADTTRMLSNYINHPSREMHLLFAFSLFEMIAFK